jgi:hypothetical protein
MGVVEPPGLVLSAGNAIPLEPISFPDRNIAGDIVG